MKAPIKLLQFGEAMADGTIRYQTQLSVFRNSDTADFIFQDGIMKVWRFGDKGFGFYEYENSYIIVDSKEEMQSQEL